MNQVLIIGYVWPEPNSSAAGGHMLSFIRLFLSQGWQVCFASPAQLSEHMTDLQAMGVRVESIPLNDSAFDQFAVELQPDIVLFDRFMMEEQFGWRIEKHCPDAIRVLDTEDLHCLRYARHQAHKSRRETTDADLHSDYALREIASIYRCDLSLIISDAELKLLTEHFGVPANLLYYCPFMLPLSRPVIAKKTFSERNDFVSIGNFRHPPNWDAVLWLKQTIWPLIRRQMPQAILNIYGAYPPKKATALDDPTQGFLVKGWATDAYEVLSDARVSLAPLRFGAGIKGKLADSMICGTPNVTTSIGAEGMTVDDGWSGFIQDDPCAFADAAVKLYQDQALWQQSQSRGFEILRHRFDGKKIGEKLITHLTELRHKLEKHRLDNFTGAMLRHHQHKSTQFMAQWIEAKNRLTALQKKEL